MTKKKLFTVLVTCLAVGLASTASAATTWTRLGSNPFYPPSLKSEADLQTLVKTRGADLKTGFAKAGYPDLHAAFMEQFPSAKIESVTVAPGETFKWVVFKKKRDGRVTVMKDVTYKGASKFDAYRFTIDKDGMRHEFVVPFVCGNVALRGMAPIPPPPPPPPPPPAPTPAPAPAPRVVPPTPPQAPAPAPVPPPAPAPAPPKPAAVVPPPSAPAPVAPPPAPVAPSAPAPAAKSAGGPLFDAGFSRQPDPANYVFARVGYELPLTGKLYLQGFLGGAVRWMGDDGGSAFTADALLDYHWLDRVSIGAGAGFWSGNDGQVDLLADLGYRVAGSPDARNLSLLFEARLPADDLGDADKFGRFGLGVRCRF